MPCNTPREKRLWEEAEEQKEEAQLKRKKEKKGKIKEPYAYQQAIFQRMKIRTGSKEPTEADKKKYKLTIGKKTKKEEQLAASKKIEFVLFAKKHNTAKRNKLMNDLAKSKDKQVREHIRFTLSILDKKLEGTE